MEGGLYQGVKNTAELKAWVIDTIPGGGTYHIENVEGTSKQWKATLLFNNIDSFRGVEEFVVKYTETNSETLKLRTKRFGTERSRFVLQAYYRCQHDTRFEKTRESLNVLKQQPCKRFKNTYYPFQLIIKVRKVPKDNFPCEIIIEHFHKHPIDSLEVTSFKGLSEQV